MAWSNIFNKAADMASNIDTDKLTNVASTIAGNEGWLGAAGDTASKVDWGSVADKAGNLFGKVKPYLIGAGTDALNQYLNKYKMYNQITSGGAVGLPKYDESLGRKWGQAIMGLGMDTSTNGEDKDTTSNGNRSRLVEAIINALRAKRTSAPISFTEFRNADYPTIVDEAGYIIRE